MGTIALDRDELMAELSDAAERFESLVRSLNPDDMNCPVVGIDWTAGETAVHVVTVIRRAVHDFRRSETPSALAELNAQCIEEVSERDPQIIADLFSAAITPLMNAIFPRLADDRQFPFHAGTKIATKH